MSEAYQIIDDLALGRIGSRFYVYDAHLGRRELVRVATKQIDGALHQLLKKLIELGPFSSRQAALAVADDDAEAQAIEGLMQLGLLTRRAAPRATTAREETASFMDREGHRLLPARRFFNLPNDIPDTEARVALCGFGLTASRDSRNTFETPEQMRALTSAGGSWFQVHDEGMVASLALDGGLPTLMCTDIAIKDDGDIPCTELRISEVFDAVAQRVARWKDHQIRPIVVGGDHSITFPLVHAMCDQYPNLGLIHFDAHNDLLYVDHATMSHAAPITSIYQETTCSPILSMGLRHTMNGAQTHRLQALEAAEAAERRLRMWTLRQTRDLLSSQARLDALIDEHRGRPFYLTIDADVLSNSATDGCVSTPAGDGLGWAELMMLVDRLGAGLDIVGCDIVEWSSLSRLGGRNRIHLQSLLFLLIERLGRASRQA